MLRDFKHQTGAVIVRLQRRQNRGQVIGEVNVDCDVLTDGDTDLKVVAYTAVPGSEDESRLESAGIISPPRSDA